MGRLKDLRKAKGYTQTKMQLLTGIDQSDYSKIENGKRYYTFEQCKRIALALTTSFRSAYRISYETLEKGRNGGNIWPYSGSYWRWRNVLSFQL